MLSEVAAKVGLSTNSITYYFKKKEDLVYECLMHTTNTISNITEIAAKETTPLARIEKFLREFSSMLMECAEGRYPSIMSFRDVAELDQSYTTVIFTAYSNMFRRTRLLLTDGSVNSANRTALTVRTHLLLTQALWSRTWLSSFNPMHHERIINYICSIIINGITVSPARWDETDLLHRLAKVEVPESPYQGFLAAAIHLINEVGYDGASIDRISARMNVTKGSFYHHIPSKEDLFSECTKRTAQIIEGMQSITLKDEQCGLEKLMALARGITEFHFSPQGPLLRISAWSEIPNFTLMHDRIKPLRILVQSAAELLADGMADGSIRVTQQQIAALLFIGMIIGATSLQKWAPGFEKTNAIELYILPFFNGLCSPL